jgi:hypothetical protein
LYYIYLKYITCCYMTYREANELIHHLTWLPFIFAFVARATKMYSFSMNSIYSPILLSIDLILYLRS